MVTHSPSPFRTLDLNLLRVFDEVMAERSLTRAAQRLSLTQPDDRTTMAATRIAAHAARTFGNAA